MSEYQNQKALILQYYENLAAANAESVEEVISKFNSTELHWYGVYPFNEQHGAPAIAEVFWQIHEVPEVQIIIHHEFLDRDR